MMYINGVTWHVGEELLPIKVESERACAEYRPIVVQADGDELEYIRDHIFGIPYTLGPVCKWRGGLACFILDNLF